MITKSVMSKQIPLKTIVGLLLFFLLPAYPANAGPLEQKPQYYALAPGQIADYIREHTDRKTVLFIYASWCPHCQQRMGSIMALEKKKKHTVIAVSLDENPMQLTRYMEQFSDVPFPVIVLDPAYKAEFAETLRQDFNIEFPGSIPFTALFNEQGQVVRQGNFVADNAAAFIFESE